MRQNADNSPAENLESYPELRIVDALESDRRRDEAGSRPELIVLGWEPRKQRLALLRSAGYKFKS
ncbi:MAG TPA: hypothetical protein VHB20_08230 [Verrucomicrobiae bacterium]|jgi:hypothetical protein|nr:hypothetical protein [Verrucomicrobiae bacterium]